MNQATFVCSPEKNRLSSSQSLSQRNKLTVSFGFILLSLIFTVSSITAQTRSTRTGSSTKQEERSRRVNKVEDADDDESDEMDDVKQPAQPPLVRKTALTYPVRTGNQPTPPALTNDIVIVSRANVSSIPTRGSLNANAGAAAAHLPNIWPVMGSLSSGFGVRNNPFGGYSREFHKGQDIAVPLGTPIMATADGIVVSACWHHGYGNAIYIDHGNGIMTRYGHLSRIDVTEGQTVKRGDLIGLSGSTGRSTGPHLHYEVRINGEATNPLPYLPPVTSPVQAK
jgi:murein DD-endopeptidase MepM/ murein hydrolase activator NlpD